MPSPRQPSGPLRLPEGRPTGRVRFQSATWVRITAAVTSQSRRHCRLVSSQRQGKVVHPTGEDRAEWRARPGPSHKRSLKPTYAPSSVSARHAAPPVLISRCATRPPRSGDPLQWPAHRFPPLARCPSWCGTGRAARLRRPSACLTQVADEVQDVVWRAQRGGQRQRWGAAPRASPKRIMARV